MEGAFFLWYLVFTVITIVIWYFLNRASVRANKQIELLESIDSKLSKILDPNFEATKCDNSAEGYLEEARKKAGL
ncbi:MAG: YebO family protein [Serratia sp. (in: enterobacteria)]|uniref:YebO family protein n=1 Tax=Serratia sp. (in: enterobacteria) TaxID=616 RepID=UPI003F35F9B4